MKAFALKKNMSSYESVTKTFVIEDDKPNKVLILDNWKTVAIEEARRIYKKYLQRGYKRVAISAKDVQAKISDLVRNETEDLSDYERSGYRQRPTYEFWDDYWDFTLLDLETVSWELGKPPEKMD